MWFTRCFADVVTISRRCDVITNSLTVFPRTVCYGTLLLPDALLALRYSTFIPPFVLPLLLLLVLRWRCCLLTCCYLLLITPDIAIATLPLLLTWPLLFPYTLLLFCPRCCRHYIVLTLLRPLFTRSLPQRLIAFYLTRSVVVHLPLLRYPHVPLLFRLFWTFVILFVVRAAFNVTRLLLPHLIGCCRCCVTGCCLILRLVTLRHARLLPAPTTFTVVRCCCCGYLLHARCVCLTFGYIWLVCVTIDMTLRYVVVYVCYLTVPHAHTVSLLGCPVTRDVSLFYVCSFVLRLRLLLMHCLRFLRYIPVVTTFADSFVLLAFVIRVIVRLLNVTIVRVPYCRLPLPFITPVCVGVPRHYRYGCLLRVATFVITLFAYGLLRRRFVVPVLICSTSVCVTVILVLPYVSFVCSLPLHAVVVTRVYVVTFYDFVCLIPFTFVVAVWTFGCAVGWFTYPHVVGYILRLIPLPPSTTPRCYRRLLLRVWFTLPFAFTHVTNTLPFAIYVCATFCCDGCPFPGCSYHLTLVAFCVCYVYVSVAVCVWLPMIATLFTVWLRVWFDSSLFGCSVDVLRLRLPHTVVGLRRALHTRFIATFVFVYGSLLLLRWRLLILTVPLPTPFVWFTCGYIFVHPVAFTTPGCVCGCCRLLLPLVYIYPGCWMDTFVLVAARLLLPLLLIPVCWFVTGLPPPLYHVCRFLPGLLLPGCLITAVWLPAFVHYNTRSAVYRTAGTMRFMHGYAFTTRRERTQHQRVCLEGCIFVLRSPPHSAWLPRSVRPLPVTVGCCWLLPRTHGLRLRITRLMFVCFGWFTFVTPLPFCCVVRGLFVPVALLRLRSGLPHSYVLPTLHARLLFVVLPLPRLPGCRCPLFARSVCLRSYVCSLCVHILLVGCCLTVAVATFAGSDGCCPLPRCVTRV